MESTKPQQNASYLFHCQLRHCEFCNWRELKRVRKKHLNRFLRCVDAGFRIALLTLTVPNVLTITGQEYDRLYECLKKLLNHPSVKPHIYGGLAKIETTFNADRGEFHPHFHILIIYRACIPQKRIKALWAALTADLENPELSDVPISQDSNRSVWIKRIGFDRSDLTSVRSAVKRSIEYICKFNPIADPEAFASFYCATKGKRLVRAFGGLRKRFKPAVGHQEPLS